MKTSNIVMLIGVAVGGYLLYQATKNTFKGTTTSDAYDSGMTNIDTSGYYGAPTTADTYNPSTKTTTTQSIGTNDFTKLIFTPTTATAADRFIVAPGSGGGGVYDRNAQQSIRVETANQRAAAALFQPRTTTPAQAAQNSALVQSVAPSVLKIFRSGINPVSTF